MSTGILSIGVSGIAAAQLGLLATEHNVTNANTPGYTRQRTMQATNIPVNTGSGTIGQGVRVQTIERMYDKYLSAQVNNAQTQVSQLDAYSSEINQIDSMLADPNAGLSPALQDFFSGVQQVASNASSLSARQSMISSAQTLTQRFHDLDTRLAQLGDEVNGRIVDAVSSVNMYASQIADINQRIIVSEAGFGQPANDLLDQRDQMINELNKLVKVTTGTNADGSFNVFIGNGQQLVVGTQVQTMTATTSSADPTKIAVGLQTAGGALELPDSLITGGQLGGLLSFRSGALGDATNELGRVASSLALTFNAQYGLGQDLLGRIAGDAGFVGQFFTLSAPNVVPNASNLGAGSLSATFAAPTAPGAPNFSGNFSTNLTTSDYQVAFGAAGAYSVTRLSDNQTVASGVGPFPISTNFDGISLNIATSGASGDKFIIQPFTGAARNIGVDSNVIADPRLINAAAPVKVTQGIANTGAMTISQGIVGNGYAVPTPPVTLTTTATFLQNVPAGWTATYSDGTTQSLAGSNVPLTNVTGAVTATLAKLSFSGMSFDINGTPAAGDSFVVGRNTAGVQDGRNAILFANLQTQNTVAGGTATFQSAYARMVADNGIRARDAKVQGDAQTAVLNSAQATRDALSGVNLDEEAANMLKFQQAYQASSKILEIGNKLFDTILSLG